MLVRTLKMSHHESYFIYLSSNKSISTEVNTPSDFYNSLYIPLDIEPELYEVALCDVWYRPKDKIFGFEPGDNILTVTQGGKTNTFIIEEPNTHQAVDLVTRLNLPLIFGQVQGVQFSATSTKIFLSCGTSKVTISPRLANLLGSNSTELVGDENEFDAINLFKDNTLYLVHCDIISPQLFGNQYKQILKVFAQPHKTNELQSTSFQTPQYLSLSSPLIDRIHLWVTNEGGVPVEFDTDSGFTCLIHLKLK